MGKEDRGRGRSGTKHACMIASTGQEEASGAEQ